MGRSDARREPRRRTAMRPCADTRWARRAGDRQRARRRACGRRPRSSAAARRSSARARSRTNRRSADPAPGAARCGSTPDRLAPNPDASRSAAHAAACGRSTTACPRAALAVVTSRALRQLHETSECEWVRTDRGSAPSGSARAQTPSGASNRLAASKPDAAARSINAHGNGMRTKSPASARSGNAGVGGRPFCVAAGWKRRAVVAQREALVDDARALRLRIQRVQAARSGRRTIAAGIADAQRIAVQLDDRAAVAAAPRPRSRLESDRRPRCCRARRRRWCRRTPRARARAARSSHSRKHAERPGDLERCDRARESRRQLRAVRDHLLERGDVEREHEQVALGVPPSCSTA